MTRMRRATHPIEAESYRILRAQANTAALPTHTQAVVERVIHASADLDYRHDLVCDEPVLAAAAAALRDGAPVVADVEMVAAGITAREVVCRVRDPEAVALSGRTGLTRSAAAMRLAAEMVGPGAIWVVGCAPTALMEIVAGDLAPALVVGLAVGFVGAVESKAALRGSGLPALSNVSAKGGSAVAAAAVNALLYLTGPTVEDSGAPV